MTDQSATHGILGVLLASVKDGWLAFKASAAQRLGARDDARFERSPMTQIFRLKNMVMVLETNVSLLTLRVQELENYNDWRDEATAAQEEAEDRMHAATNGEWIPRRE